ncbi:hypothetical protein G7046_g6470 [Stylonectria norvegica]|nr:hypothetical protein G7046_g6470 [Stylonectria norvegica]
MDVVMDASPASNLAMLIDDDDDAGDAPRQQGTQGPPPRLSPVRTPPASNDGLFLKRFGCHPTTIANSRVSLTTAGATRRPNRLAFPLRATVRYLRAMPSMLAASSTTLRSHSQHRWILVNQINQVDINVSARTFTARGFCVMLHRPRDLLPTPCWRQMLGVHMMDGFCCNMARVTCRRRYPSSQLLLDSNSVVMQRNGTAVRPAWVYCNPSAFAHGCAALEQGLDDPLFGHTAVARVSSPILRRISCGARLRICSLQRRC